MFTNNVTSLRRHTRASVSSTAAEEDLAASFASVRRYLFIGGGIVLALVGATFMWGIRTEISGAVITSGVVVVDGNAKKIQHPSGGVVGQINVKEGDHVEARDVLMRLDDTVTRANLQLITKQLDEIAIRESRLKAELKGDSEIKFPQPLISRMDDPVMTEIIQTEQLLFSSRLTANRGRKSQLRERIIQLGQEINGLDAQQNAKKRELDLAETELAAITQLEEKHLVSVAKITASRRLVAQLDGDLAQLVAQSAQGRAKIAETELQILQLDDEIRVEGSQALREQQSKSAELTERRAAAEDQLNRIEIRAPQSGTVHQLSAHTVGGVVSPGEQIMLIVPNNDQLVIEAKLPPQEIDQVRVGNASQIRFSAFNQRTTPEFSAVVTHISADAFHEGQGGQTTQISAAVGGISYYVVRLGLTNESVKVLNDLVLLPGMPAEVHIKTGERSFLSYILKPLRDQFARTFRER